MCAPVCSERVCMYVYQLSLVSSEAAYAQRHALLRLGYVTVRLIYPLD